MQAHAPSRPWWTRPPALAATVVVLLAVAAAAAFALLRSPAPVIVPANNGLYVGDSERIPVSGQVTGLPPSAQLVLVSPSGQEVAVHMDDAGSFEQVVTVDAIEELQGSLKVVDNGRVLAQGAVTVKRIPPERVSIQIETVPPVPNGTLLVTPTDASGTVAEISLDAHGRGSAAVRYGEFAVSLTSDDYILEDESIVYQTGHQPSRPVTLQARSTLREVQYRIDPPDATVEISPLRSPDSSRPVQLDDLGRATGRLSIGDYQVIVSADGYDREQVRLSVGTRDRPSVEVVLRPHAGGDQPVNQPLAQLFPNLSVMPGLDDIDGAILDGLPLDEFKAYVQMHAPLDSLVFDADDVLDTVWVRGSVLSDHERDMLFTRLRPAERRLHYEVQVDPLDVSLRLQSALLAAGAEDVKVRPRKDGEDTVMVAEFTQTAALNKSAARKIADRYTLDARRAQLIAY